MRRSLLPKCCLFLCLLLMALPYMVEAVKSETFKISAAKYSSESRAKIASTTLVNEMKFQKAPSGPNPVGNHRPPTRQ